MRTGLCACALVLAHACALASAHAYWLLHMRARFCAYVFANPSLLELNIVNCYYRHTVYHSFYLLNGISVCFYIIFQAPFNSLTI